MLSNVCLILILVALVVESFGERQVRVVDIGGLTTESGSYAVREIDLALRSEGLVIIKGHSDATQLELKSFEAAHELFGLPFHSKTELSVRNDPTSFGRGYLGFGEESGLASNFEPKEGYSYGSPVQGSTANQLNMPNKWPADLSEISKDRLEQTYTRTVTIAQLLADALGTQFTCTNSKGALSLSEIAKGGEHISLMRLFHYYNHYSHVVQERLHRYPDHSAVLGSSPHTDWGFLTVILADEVGGLQFLRRGGDVRNNEDWLDVPYIPGSLVVNGGDYLSLISRGVYHSPVHRVLSPGAGSQLAAASGEAAAGDQRDRYSFVLFFYPAYSSPVSADVLAHCRHWTEEQTQRGTEAGEMEGAGAEKGRAGGDRQEREAVVTATGYNTLLNLQGERPRSFGDYVIRKWEGVYKG